MIQSGRLISFPKKQGGFSLVELIAAVAITMLTVVVVVAVIRKGTDIRITNAHRARGRAIIDSCLESPSYRYENYDFFAADTHAILIDPRDQTDSTDNLYGGIRITVTPDTIPPHGTGIDAVALKRLYIKVSWLEPGETSPQEIALSKQITKLRE